MMIWNVSDNRVYLVTHVVEWDYTYIIIIRYKNFIVKTLLKLFNHLLLLLIVPS